jgi:hypothetical protein
LQIWDRCYARRGKQVNSTKSLEVRKFAATMGVMGVREGGLRKTNQPPNLNGSTVPLLAREPPILVQVRSNSSRLEYRADAEVKVRNSSCVSRQRYRCGLVPWSWKIDVFSPNGADGWNQDREEKPKPGTHSVLVYASSAKKVVLPSA